MFWIAIAMVVFVVIVGLLAIPPDDPSKEAEGPMPKKHGGFAQRVHGGKS